MRQTPDMLIETDYRALASAGQDGLPLNISGGVVAIGNFDGVHRGHQALLAEGRAIADRLGVPLVALTFAPHPRQFFQPDKPPFLLSDSILKNDYLHQAGADAVVSLQFDGILAGVPADEFVTNILRDALRAKHIVVGADFIFGSNRGGNVMTLQSIGKDAGFGVTPLAAVTHEFAERISSEAVRNALRHGHTATAEQLLGRPWQFRGVVIRGDQRGRTIGYPTANIALGDFIHPKFGVYSARVLVEETGEEYLSALSVGIRPMFELRTPLLEAYLMDFDGDLYGRTLRVSFGDFLRPEMKFLDLDELKAQIAKDVDRARELLQSTPIL